MEAGSQSSNRQPIDVIFNSAESDNGNVDFPNFTLDPPLDNIVGASVQWISAPFSYYVIDRTNNFFRLGFYYFYDRNSDALNDDNNLRGYNTAPEELFNIINPNADGFSDFTLPKLDSDPPETFLCRVVWDTCTIYLTPGSYTPETLEAEINRQATAAVHYQQIGQQNVFKTYFGFDQFSLQLNPNTSKLTISNLGIPTGFYYDFNLQGKRFARSGFMISMGTNKSLADILGMPYSENENLSSLRDTMFLSSMSNTGETQTASVDSTDIRDPFFDLEKDYYVASVTAQRPCNLIETNKLNVHSNLASLMSVARTSKQNNDILTCVPIDTNYSQYILNVQTAEMKMLTRCVISNVQFYMTLGGRRLYSNSGHQVDFLNFDGDNTKEIPSPTRLTEPGDLPKLPFTTQPYIHFNGEPFMVCIRFYRDDGQMAQ